VGDELAGLAVAGGRAFEGGVQPRRHQGGEAAIGHVGVAQADRGGGGGQAGGVVLQALQQFGGEADPVFGLAQQRAQPAQLGPVQAQDQFALPGQGGGDGVGAGIG